MGTAFNPNEFRTVDDLYTKGLNRQGDQGGLDYWRSQFGDSIDANEFAMFKNSAMPEYNANRAANTPASSFSNIDDLYRGVLNRGADQQGAEYWRSQFGDVIDSTEEAQFRRSAQAELDRVRAEQNNAKASAITNPYGQNPYANSKDPYIIAAQQNSIANTAATERATVANRVNQQTPYGNVTYTQTGVDSAGNPIWNAKQDVAPEFQESLTNLQNNVRNQTSKPFDVSATQNERFTAENPNFERMGDAPTLQRTIDGGGMTGWDRANELLMSRLRPQMEQRSQALDARLANQGIMPGTEAYNRARLTNSQADNDMMTQAQLAGSQVQNQFFNQNLAGGNFNNAALTSENNMNLQNRGFNNSAMQQGFGNEMAKTTANNLSAQNNFTQNLTAYNNPLQQLNAFRTGTAPAYAGVAAQVPVAGPNYLDAYNLSIANQIAGQNAQLASEANRTSGMYSLINAGLTGSGGIPGLVKGVGDAVTGAGKVWNWLSGRFE